MEHITRQYGAQQLAGSAECSKAIGQVVGGFVSGVIGFCGIWIGITNRI